MFHKPMIPPTLLTPPILLYTSELIAIAIFYVPRELKEAFEKNDSFITTAMTMVL